MHLGCNRFPVIILLLFLTVPIIQIRSPSPISEKETPHGSSEGKSTTTIEPRSSTSDQPVEAEVIVEAQSSSVDEVDGNVACAVLVDLSPSS